MNLANCKTGHNVEDMLPQITTINVILSNAYLGYKEYVCLYAYNAYLCFKESVEELQKNFIFL